MPLPREIIKLCPGLVTIVDVPRRETEFPVWDLHESETRMTQEIRLSHFSVKEYFTSDRIDKRIHNNLCQRPAAACIASVLLTYLLHLDLQMSLSELRSAFPLSWYSARHWMSFVRLAEAGSDTTQRLTMQLLLSQQQYKRWRSVHDPDKPWEEVPDLKSQPSPLYYASLEGLEHATVALLKKGANVNAQGGQYTTAICAASQRGHTQIVKLLLKHNADVNTRVLFGVNFEINFESDLKEYQMQLMLLEQQNRTRLHRARQLRDDTAAQATSSRYHGDIEGYLHPGYCSNALCAASAGNHMDIVSLLFEGGADLNIQCRQCGNALYTACDRGHMGVVEMLIENGAEVNAQGGYYGNALQAASTNGYERVVEVLLENGAEVNTQGGHYGNALQAACVGGYERIVELLLEKNADIDAWGGKYNDALQAANLCGFDKISRMLRRQLEDSCSRNQAKHLIEGQNQLSERSISSKRRCAGERLASCAVKGVTGDT
jgi:ankyrin repeat protein